MDEECRFNLDVKVGHNIFKQLTEGEAVELTFNVAYEIEEGDIRLEALRECYNEIESLIAENKHARIMEFSLSPRDSHIKLIISVVAPTIADPHKNFVNKSD